MQAHPGHDEPAKASTGASTDEVLLPKESQFLFTIRTQLVRTDSLSTRRTLVSFQRPPAGRASWWLRSPVA